MLFLIKSYIQFLWNSKNEHAVHSPFVFHLVTQCFYDHKFKQDYLSLNHYRSSLLKNSNTIEVTDFGSGSKVFKSNKREVSKIAKTAGISKKRAKLLYRMVHYFRVDPSKNENQFILEIGTSLGLATVALALGNPNAKITTLEGCSETANQCRQQLQKLNINTVDLVVTEFDDYFKNCNLESTRYNMIYFDGNHSKKATLNYFELVLPTITNDTVWIFDDIHWSAEMEEAWTFIKKHPKVTVTIDTFQWGIVFFRKEQAKEHFVIRV